jgi:hypothetical protein
VVIISTGEIAPDFGRKPAMIAYERNGQDLDNKSLRLVMPGDKRVAVMCAILSRLRSNSHFPRLP